MLVGALCSPGTSKVLYATFSHSPIYLHVHMPMCLSNIVATDGAKLKEY